MGHSFFPHISPLCQGLISESLQTIKDLMVTATTQTGLKLLTTILYNTYQIGRNVAVDFKSNLKIVFDEFLPQWNYTPKPQLQVISSTILTKCCEK
ncbi:ISAzo13-like element transposase-related protein [Trichormus azollae]|uniref:ISAzo13-like element transposase-related protein n=1 Tax=Trichormus azollae TaxID=1164 RepID=UPI00325EAEE8